MSSNAILAEEADLFHDLPARWKHYRIHNVASLRTSNVNKKSEENENPVQLCNYTDVYYNDRITAEIEFMQATASEAEIERFSLEPGDVVITKDSESPDDIGVPALIEEKIDGLVCGYHLTIVRPFESVINGSYLFYALASRLSAYQFYLASNGVTRFGLTYQGTKNLRIGFPSLPEQKQIADFLDYKTVQIDALIAKKKELIEKLKEQRIAVITQAVNKGIDPSAPTRDSGIDWLGQVPEHWDVLQLGRMITLQRGVDITKDEQEEGDVPVVSSGGIASYHSVPLMKGPGVIVGRKGTAGSVHYIDSDYWPHDTTLYVKDFWGNHPRFVYYKLLSMNLASFDTGTANPTVNRNRVHPEIVSWPPITEQSEIVSFLDTVTERIDRMIEKVTSAIDRLTEYRTALITAATTAKIDVRGVKLDGAK
jgi:type I restriction enzyme S subunit